jgi:hypothetical protein
METVGKFFCCRGQVSKPSIAETVDVLNALTDRCRIDPGEFLNSDGIERIYSQANEGCAGEMYTK